MPYTNRKSLKYENQVLETNKIYKRPPYILNNSIEKNATQWGRNGLILIYYFFSHKRNYKPQNMMIYFFHMLIQAKRQTIQETDK